MLTFERKLITVYLLYIHCILAHNLRLDSLTKILESATTSWAENQALTKLTPIKSVLRDAGFIFSKMGRSQVRLSVLRVC